MFNVRLRKLRSALCTLGLVFAIVLLFLTTQMKSNGNLSYFYTSTVYHNSRHIHRDSFNVINENGKKRNRLFPEDSKTENHDRDVVVLGLKKLKNNPTTTESYTEDKNEFEFGFERPSIRDHEFNFGVKPLHSEKQPTKVVGERQSGLEDGWPTIEPQITKHLPSTNKQSSEVADIKGLQKPTNKNALEPDNETTDPADVRNENQGVSTTDNLEIHDATEKRRKPRHEVETTTNIHVETTEDRSRNMNNETEDNEFEESENAKSETKTEEGTDSRNTVKNTLDMDKELEKHLGSNEVVGNLDKGSLKDVDENTDSIRHFIPDNNDGEIQKKAQFNSDPPKSTQHRSIKTRKTPTDSTPERSPGDNIEEESLGAKMTKDGNNEDESNKSFLVTKLHETKRKLSKAPQNSYLSPTFYPSTTQESDSPKDETSENLNTDTLETPDQNCKPAESVVFLKTHKTGSSTILNIFQRYVDRKQLSMVLPRLPETNHRLGWPYSFSSGWVFEHKKNQRYNMLANHARYNRKKMLSVMKEPQKTKFVTILRDPLRQLESSAVYFHFERMFKIPKENLVDHFLEKVEEDRNMIWNMTRKPRGNMYLVKNPNAFDLGFPTWLEDEEKVDAILDTVEKDYNLVMISDYMIESLVLLKDELCWNLEDIVYFTLNKRPKKYRQKIQDDSIRRNKVRRWNNIDYKLFEHFNQTFWERVRKGGERFQKDVERLKLLNKELEEKCIDRGTYFDKSQPWFPILGYKIRDEAKGTDYYNLCQQMIKPEIEFNNFLRQKQSEHGWTPPPKKARKPKPPPKKVVIKS
ncbi:uncharacterized protein [Clytia hemisphaerica]|uniref:Uncharacterized protein n=1 Tax=Clytia hemisphaerica TaxID=252671 RepID=A0A7M5UZN4_9CNID